MAALAIIGMILDVVLSGIEWIQATEQINTVPIIHRAKLCRRHQVTAQLVIRHTVPRAFPVTAAGIDAAYCLFSQCLGNIFQRGIIGAAQEDGTVTVRHKDFPVILVQRFNLTEGLQDDGAGNLVLSHSGKSLAEIRNCADVCELVKEKAHMAGQPLSGHSVSAW